MDSGHRPQSGHTQAIDEYRPPATHRPPATTELQIRRLWLTQAQALETLGCSERTLRRRVRSGLVERRQQGRQALYRILNSDTGHTGQTPDTGHNPAKITTPATGRDGVAGVADVAAIRLLVERLEAQAVELVLAQQTIDQQAKVIEGLRLDLDTSHTAHQDDLVRWRRRISRWKRKYGDS